ncbi:conserved hypothetical protein [Plasmopara halstedii]|uniref:Tetraspanin/Peripherin n=1 Tax=Plasmopara halstedii TaxID=4781 RepID=A0A0P1ABM4_PLAHL|nr:conserved hypothetical protein [Plasmopara halstedii]CEG37849.1 conserved hypothetical protein [Plasmopara halstedii]|eukprot:XP_024574218.1 conserved hypothetical protein [Plasmopara halstedii]
MGWVEVIKGYWSPIDAIITVLIVIASVVIALALLGSLASVCRWRLGLCIYSNVIIVIFILFVFVSGAALSLRHQAATWEGSTFPASSNEKIVKENFDQAFCYAQGAFVCNQASVSDALAMFVPTLDLSTLSHFKNMSGGVYALCDDHSGDFDMLSSLCKGCDQAWQFKTFSSLLDWADEKCPRSLETWIWCGIFLNTGETSTSHGTAPYTECRAEFLDLVKKHSFWLGVCSIIVCTDAIMVLTFACILRRRDRQPTSLVMLSVYGRI